MSSREPTEIDALIPPDQRPPAYSHSLTHADPSAHDDGLTGTVHDHGARGGQPKHKRSLAGAFPGGGAIPRVLLFVLLFILTFLSLLVLLSLLLALAQPAIASYLPPHRSSTSLPMMLSLFSALVALTALLTFDAPSVLTRIALAFDLAFAALALILVGSVQQLRLRENWLGAFVLILFIVTLATALGSSIYVERKNAALARSRTALTAEEADVRAHVIYAEGGYWGTRIKRALKIFFAFVLAFAIAIALFLITVNLIVGAFTSSLPLPFATSQLVSVQPAPSRWPYRVHMACAGNKDETVHPSIFLNEADEKKPPTVVCESMSGVSGTENCEWVIRMAEEGVGRACMWDRPGYGFSDSGPTSDLLHVQAALLEALTAAGESPPYMLVGAGYGGLVTRLFASLHPELTHSLLYVDAQHPKTYFHPPAPPTFPSFLQHVSSPLGLTRIGNILRGQSTRRELTLGPTNDGLIKARLSELLQSHRWESPSSLAVNSSTAQYPHDVPHIVLSSRQRIEAKAEWDRDQRRVWGEARGPAKKAWRVVNVTHDVCQSVRGEGECRRAVEELLLL